MGAAIHTTIDLHNEHRFTRHAWERMNKRGLPSTAVRQVLNFGRAVYVRGATIYVVGRKEVKSYLRDGIDLSSVEGVQIVCSDDGSVLTVYRNRDFRGLRPRSRRTHHRLH